MSNYSETTRIEEFASLTSKNEGLADLVAKYPLKELRHISPPNSRGRKRVAIFSLKDGNDYKYSANKNRTILDNIARAKTLDALYCQQKVADIEGIQPIPFVGFYEGIPGLTRLPYIPGPHLDRKKQLPKPDKLLELYDDLAATLERVHQRGILHRDIKPGNLVHYNNKLWIIDWDIASSFEQDQRERDGNLFCGTPGYLWVWPDRGRDYFAAGISFLKNVHGNYDDTIKRAQTLNPTNIENFIDSEYTTLQKHFDADIAGQFWYLMTRPNEYPIEEKDTGYSRDNSIFEEDTADFELEISTEHAPVRGRKKKRRNSWPKRLYEVSTYPN